MKDLPHYLNKLNRKVIRSAHREEVEDQAYELERYFQDRKPTERQIKKQAKARIRKERLSRTPQHKSAEQKNREQATRGPTFNWAHIAPPPAKPSRKKRPRL